MQTKGSAFPPTRWSMVLAAQDDSSAVRERGLDDLCRAYWHPIYAFARSRGHNPADAEDLVQGLFVTLLNGDSLRRVGKSKGKLRTFLLAAATRHMAMVHRNASRQKRGGGSIPIPIDTSGAEDRYSVDPRDQLNPELIFEQHWALMLLDRVMERLHQTYIGENKAELFDGLKDVLAPGTGSPGYRELGSPLGLSEGAVKVAVHRMRKRYKKFLLEEIEATLEDGDDPEEEIRHLFTVFAR